MDDALWYWYTLPFFTGYRWVCWHQSLLIVLDGIGTPYHFFLVIVCRDHIERNALKKYWWCSSSFLGLIGRALWVSSRSICHCWLMNAMWTELLISWQHRLDFLQGNISEQGHILLCSINLSFSLPLVGGGLEGVYLLKVGLIES